jgi:hypothetical protein
MEKERVQRYVANLEQVMRSTHLDLRGTMIQFQECSQRLSKERTIPPGIIIDIRKIYMGIHDQLTKIKGINQLLENRYKPYYRVWSLVQEVVHEIRVYVAGDRREGETDRKGRGFRGL